MSNVSEPQKSFCSEYIILNSATEIPPAFTAWCSLSAISCALGRRIWIDMGAFRIYPNMFIVLIAGSGQMRKSTAVNVTRDILEALSPVPNLIAQKLTAEALIDAMKRLPPAVGKILVGSGAEPIGQGMVITDELTNFLNRGTNDGGMVPMLIEFYDCRKRFTYQTRGKGMEVLRDTSLGMLAATTPEELRKAIPEEVIGSGLASRILFVYETTPAKPIAFPTYTTRHTDAKDFCVRFLQRISTLEGPVPISEDSRVWCEECYTQRCFNSPLLDDPHLRGYASRRYIHILKLALNLSVGLTERPVITPEILTRAEKLVVYNEVMLQKVVQLVTMNEKGAVISFVLGLVQKHKKITRQDLTRLVSHRLDTRELNEITETLIRSHQIECIVNGPQIFYIIRS